MYLILRLSVVLSSLSWSFAVEASARERMHWQLSASLKKLEEAQQRLIDHAGTAQLVVPAAVPTQIAMRRTLAAEWQRRIETPASEFRFEEAKEFLKGLSDLSEHVSRTADWVGTMSSLGENWHGIATSTELDRYRVFLRDVVDTLLSRLPTEAEWSFDYGLIDRRRGFHEIILSLVESQAEFEERAKKLPEGTVIVAEIRTRREQVRTTAESGLNVAISSNDDELYGEQSNLEMLNQLLSLVERHHQYLASREREGEQPPDAAIWELVTTIHKAEEQSLRAFIAHWRARKPDDPAWDRQENSLRHVREERERISDLAWEFLMADDRVQEYRREIQSRITQDSPALRDAAMKRATALENSYSEAKQGYSAALKGGKRIDAIRAKGAMRFIEHEFGVLLDDLEFQQVRLNQENKVLARVGEAIAPTAFDAVIAARTRRQVAEREVWVADLAHAIAGSAVDDAQAEQDRAYQEEDQARKQLEQRLKQIIDQIENPPAKPEDNPQF